MSGKRGIVYTGSYHELCSIINTRFIGKEVSDE